LQYSCEQFFLRLYKLRKGTGTAKSTGTGNYRI
jgi:hypothetical protein